MVNKCCVPKCDGNYVKKNNVGEKYLSMYKFPNSEEEKSLWMKAIPRANLKDLKDPRVCEKHWPSDAEYICVQGGHKRPLKPPSVFENIPQSCLSSLPKVRTTKKSLSNQRSIQNDQLEEFNTKDALRYEIIVDFILKEYENLLV